MIVVKSMNNQTERAQVALNYFNNYLVIKHFEFKKSPKWMFYSDCHQGNDSTH